MKSKCTFRMGKKWAYLEVVRFNHTKELKNLAIEWLGFQQEFPAFLATYKPALKEVEKSLSEELRIKYRADAIKWTNDKPPQSEQYWYVHASYSSQWNTF